jgi:hypothetical protein
VTMPGPREFQRDREHEDGDGVDDGVHGRGRSSTAQRIEAPGITPVP